MGDPIDTSKSLDDLSLQTARVKSYKKISEQKLNEAIAEKQKLYAYFGWNERGKIPQYYVYKGWHMESDPFPPILDYHTHNWCRSISEQFGQVIIIYSAIQVTFLHTVLSVRGDALLALGLDKDNYFSSVLLSKEKEISAHER